MVQDLSNVLKAARRTLFYGPRLGIIADAPVVTIAEFYAQRNTFNDPAACPRRPEFHYPIQPSPNVAVLISGFRAAENMRMISDIRREELERLSGWAFAAPVGLLRDMAHEELELYIDALVGAGCLKVVGKQYPTVSTTELGDRVMREQEQVALALPRP